MAISRIPHEWCKEAFFSKAQRYVEQMYASDASEWQFGFWSGLALEFLIKATLANISPILVADGNDWSNLFYAVGGSPNQKKFVPRTADVSLMLASLEKAFPDFTKEMLDIGAANLNRRNTELHSGALPYDNLGSSSWLPGFCVLCEFLLTQMGESLDTLCGKEMADDARIHIQAFRDEAAKAVKQSINAHKTLWEELGEDERTEKENQAKNASLRYFGHRVNCPACNSVALLHGSAAGTRKKEVDGGEIVERQRMVPANFECPACGLKINGYSKLLACGLGDAFVSHISYSPIEYFDIDIVDEYHNIMDEDNNE